MALPDMKSIAATMRIHYAKWGLLALTGISAILLCAYFAQMQPASAQSSSSSSQTVQSAEEGGMITLEGTRPAAKKKLKLQEAPRPGIPIGEEELRRLKSLPGAPPPEESDPPKP
jgi:hypothetical protein